jgi:hypothetical protein
LRGRSLANPRQYALGWANDFTLPKLTQVPVELRPQGRHFFRGHVTSLPGGVTAAGGGRCAKMAM